VNKFSFSILWLALTVIIIALLIMPIYQNCGENYPFYLEDIICILIAVTFTRYIFLLDYHWFARNKTLKIILAFSVIPMLFYIVDAQYEFQRYIDEEGVDTLLLPGGNPAVAEYARNQFRFFWAFAMICCFAIPIKMIRSIWRDYKANAK
jgi:hypothetical protein